MSEPTETLSEFVDRVYFDGGDPNEIAASELASSTRSALASLVTAWESDRDNLARDFGCCDDTVATLRRCARELRNVLSKGVRVGCCTCGPCTRGEPCLGAQSHKRGWRVDRDCPELRESFAADMMSRGLATGHGDSLADLHRLMWEQFDELRQPNDQAHGTAGGGNQPKTH